MPTLNLGILAHVDAGKTSLTERLLYAHGAVATLGSVDAGSATTDSGELERERGITIRSAVASFALGDLRVNLIDTPGHPDFIAEVERALAVLDGAVLVLSAVEGVQAQTRVLLRSLRRLGIPTLVFVNKIDRAGARGDALLADIRAKLGVAVVALNAVRDPGGPAAEAVPRAWAGAAAEILADHDDELLAALVDGHEPGPAELRDRLAAQTGAGHVHPLFFGSATTGAGTGQLAEGIATLLRPRPVDDDTADDARGLVFAVERGVAYLRLFSGVVRERQRLVLHRPGPDGTTAPIRGRVTAVEVVGAAGAELTAGGIGRLHGLRGVRVGDRLGGSGDPVPAALFSPPSLESLVRPRDPAQQGRLHAVLTALADEDPLIRARAVPGGGTSVLLHGAVQREVLADRLARDFGLAVEFGEIRPVYFERVTGTGECVIAFDPRRPNDFWATVGLRVEPGPPGSGLRYIRDVQPGAVPQAFHRATEEAVRRTVEQGLYGWEVVDCTVTVIRTGYRAPISAAADFRGLAPVVLLRALRDAGTRVCEPCQAFEAEVPAAAVSAVLGRLALLGADVTGSAERDGSWLVTGRLPARLTHEFAGALPGLTHGEGALWSRPGPDRPLRGPAPREPRRDGNPLRYEEYRRFLAARSPQAATVTAPTSGGTSAGHSGRANR
ncbi:tetracycline resistance ribosomal protection protein Otr(A) [Amorphoplanes nipponensis]|uniref:Tetracycline resistance protein n=1 Tax=Actinoplanes nipponensis TaxID=135950 RepID=A0A919MNM0_9ACTN|nr:TetM/TetW/TetO/TetS family tetracycline resistance ribosomal protection protein [Actinoplanes nipponensis]GIE48603.1 tetracycline resistance protein [Actinoplanes nipponensis]